MYFCNNRRWNDIWGERQAVCDFYGYELYDFLAAGDVFAEGDHQLGNLSDADHDLDKHEIALLISDRI